MRWADRSGKGNYLTIFCLFDLICDVCYELVVIMEFGSISESGWGGVFGLASWRTLEEKLSAQGCSNSQMRHRVLEESVKEGPGDTLSPGTPLADTDHRPPEHLSFFEKVGFKICHLFVPDVSVALILAHINGACADKVIS